MKTVSLSPFALLLLVTTTLAPGALLNDYTNAEGVAFTAGFVPDATRVMVREPFFLTFVVSNRSERTMHFDSPIDEFASITATNSNGKRVTSRPIVWDGPVKTETLPPGKACTARVFMHRHCVFEEPGEYAVNCSLQLRHVEIKTNELDRAQSGRRFTFGPAVVTTFKLTVLPMDPAHLTHVIASWAWVVVTNGALSEASLALAAIDDERTIAPLTSLVCQNAEDVVAVNALSHYTNAAAADALAMVLMKGSDYPAMTAGKALRASHQDERIVRSLLPRLTNQYPSVRLSTARAVSWTGSEIAFAPVLALLQDENNTVRYGAAEAIGRFRDPRSFAVLTNCLESSDFALRVAAVKGLHALGRTVELAWVKPMIMSGAENVRTYYEAIDLLRMYGGDQAAVGLASCLHFDDPSVRHSYNMRLILALESIPNGPKYYYKWHSDPNRDGTEDELRDNRGILCDLLAWFNQQTNRPATASEIKLAPLPPPKKLSVDVGLSPAELDFFKAPPPPKPQKPSMEDLAKLPLAGCRHPPSSAAGVSTNLPARPSKQP